jgi:hypothetical protein
MLKLFKLTCTVSGTRQKKAAEAAVSLKQKPEWLNKDL